jgi:ATP-dependent Clp protease ATP-binding subunit ClpC
MLGAINFPSEKIGQKLTNHAKNSLAKAALLAQKFGQTEVQNMHLLFAIHLEKGSLGSSLLHDLKLKKEDFLSELSVSQSNVPLAPTESATISLSQESKDILLKAFSAAKKFNHTYVGTEHLAYALFNSSGPVLKKLLAKAKPQNKRQALRAALEPDQLSGISQLFNLPDNFFTKNQKTHSSATPAIDKFCFNINADVKKKAEIIIGRKKELDRLINILGRKNKNNPLLIGEPGVGKTALVIGLAQLINFGLVPSFLYGKKIMSLDVAGLIAGTSFRGEFEMRLKEILKEASQSKDIIIFIDEIHNIIGAGNVSGSLDLANILKPALSRGEVQIIGATTFSEYKKHLEKDAALARRFQAVSVQEPSEKETQEILSGVKNNYEKFHNVVISERAIALAVELSSRYIQNRFLPDKAIDTLDETASNVRSRNKVSDFLKEIKDLENQKTTLFHEKEKLTTEENYEKALALTQQEKELNERIKEFKNKQAAVEKTNPVKITERDIAETIAKISGVPMEKLFQDRTFKLKNIQKILSAQIIGQKEILEKLSDVLLRSQSGVSSPDRPLGSFLFLGPTGVGKTLTAKILAREFFDSSSEKAQSLIRIDMSELMERHSIASLIGSPAGYIGYGECGNLTEKVRRNPYAVILFDEIEKAHPDVSNLLLQILEDGILTDAEGTPVSFKNTIIIMTSNLGTEDFTNASAKIGFGKSPNFKETAQKFNAIKETALKELRARMKPELLNRLDYILVFSALDKKSLQTIAKLELHKLAERLKKQDLILLFQPTVLSYLTEKSLAVNQGARLIRKNIQDLIENKIAELIVYGKVKKKKINLSVINKKLIIQ